MAICCLFTLIQMVEDFRAGVPIKDANRRSTDIYNICVKTASVPAETSLLFGLICVLMDAFGIC